MVVRIVNLHWVIQIILVTQKEEQAVTQKEEKAVTQKEGEAVTQKGAQVEIHQLVDLEINSMVVQFRMFLLAKIILIWFTWHTTLIPDYMIPWIFVALAI